MLISLIPIFFSTVSNLKSTYRQEELFKIELTQFKNINDLMAHIEGIYSVNHPLDKIDTSAYVKLCSEIVKRRFHHGISNYSIHENWIAFLCGKIFWSHFSVIVDPNDILNYNQALCSQQAIVFMELLNKKGIKNRNVGIGSKDGKGHFLSEVYYNNSWHLFDVNKEPHWNKVVLAHQSMDFYIKNKDSLYKIYHDKLTPIQINHLIETINYGQPNTFPAKNMLLFHRITKIMTYLIPIFFCILIFLTILKQRIPNKIIKKTSAKIKFKKVDYL